MLIQVDTTAYFQIRQQTGIPFTKLVNLAGQSLLDAVENMKKTEREEFALPYRLRTPERQQELDRKKGYV